MPFIGRDWRSPGEAWVKTESLGWQRMKIIESQLHPGCHQHHNLACSWPPPSQAGQLMAKNCGGEGEDGHMKFNSNENNENETGLVKDEILCGGLTSDGGSACNSDSSASTSPISSPEKNNAHHLHPITISSPYGSFSCCSHYLNQTPDSVVGNYLNQSTAMYCGDHHKQESAQHIARSLSRESLDTSAGHHLYTSCSNVPQRMLYNNSFSNTTGSSYTSPLSVIKHHHRPQLDRAVIDLFENESAVSSPLTDDKSAQIDFHAPVILENGVRICDQKPSENTRKSRVASVADSGQGGSRENPKSRSVSPNCKFCCCNFRPAQTTNQQMDGNNSNNIQQQKMTAPHCRVSVRTREVAMYNTISEAFYRLDFYNAIHDIRRFNYICKLLHLLITQNLTSLSGCATRVLFTMLEQVAWEVSSNKRNIHVIRNLLDELNETIQKYYCWGRPIGSSVLWQQHFDTIDRISRIVDEIELSQSQTDQKESELTFDKLPIEMIREILLRLNDYRDLVNSAQVSPVMRNMIDEQSIWQKLCQYHFTDQQLKLVFENSSCLNRVKRTTLRGIKYARTVSANGKVSYRNPVARKRVSSRSLMKNDPEHRQSIGTRSKSSSSSSDSDGPPTESTSHVTKTIKIFDREGTSSILSSTSNGGSRMSARHGQLSRNARSQISGEHISKANGNPSSTDCADSVEAKDTNLPNTDIDWELVFHQLRKKFDLKEEYADCLLLCRHCRCLFWKSIGHPCIMNDEERWQARQQTCQDNIRASRTSDPNQQTGISNRPSVASLSRTFDERARVDNDENTPPSAHRNGGGGNIASCSRPVVELPAGSGLPLSPPPANRNLRELNQHALRRAANVEQEASQSHSRKANRDELVPKHITITPQAFLKFFSL